MSNDLYDDNTPEVGKAVRCLSPDAYDARKTRIEIACLLSPCRTNFPECQWTKDGNYKYMDSQTKRNQAKNFFEWNGLVSWKNKNNIQT